MTCDMTLRPLKKHGGMKAAVRRFLLIVAASATAAAGSPGRC
jgi:hypothetical protein